MNPIANVISLAARLSDFGKHQIRLLRRISKVRLLLILAGLLPACSQAESNLVITSFASNGRLTWSNLAPNSTCRVEWASSLNGPWTNTWDHLNNISTGTNTQLSAFVPMFYRVVMTVPPSTPANTYTIDWAALQWPLNADVQIDQPVTVYGRVYIAGLTDQSFTNDTAENVVADFGYGPEGSDPAASTDWVWTRGTPNPSYVGADNNDEYIGSFSVPQAGRYDFTVRFSGDGGISWVNADSSGTTDGYQASDAGKLTVYP